MKVRSLSRDSRFILGIFATALCFGLYADPYNVFAYQRDEIFAGEYWRLLTGHFTHTAPYHLGMNVAALLMIWIYGWQVLSALAWSISLLLCAILSSALFLFLLPDLTYYEGLSGVLHGLLVVAAAARLRVTRADFTAWIVLVFIVIKLAYEAVYGPSEITQEMVHLPILTEAHLYGSCVGLCCSLGFGLFEKMKDKPGSRRSKSRAYG